VLASLLLTVLVVTVIPPAEAHSLIQSLVKNSAFHRQSWLGLGLNRKAIGTPQTASQNRGMPPSPINPPGFSPQRPEHKQEKEARIYKLDVNPSTDITLQTEQRMIFAAIPVDQDGNAIHGLKAEWESSEPKVISITNNGEVVALNIGSATITATVGDKQQTVKVTVIAEKSLSIDQGTMEIQWTDAERFIRQWQ
jgi:hypothetical protein